MGSVPHLCILLTFKKNPINSSKEKVKKSFLRLSRTADSVVSGGIWLKF